MSTDKPTEGESVAAALAEKDKSSAASVQSAGHEDDSDNIEQNQCSLMDLDDCAFKTPQKRRLKQHHIGKQTKRMDNCELSQTDTESESDFSECRVSCSLPQSGFSSRVYTVDDIKSFLKITKNARKV